MLDEMVLSELPLEERADFKVVHDAVRQKTLPHVVGLWWKTREKKSKRAGQPRLRRSQNQRPRPNPGLQPNLGAGTGVVPMGGSRRGDFKAARRGVARGRKRRAESASWTGVQRIS